MEVPSKKQLPKFSPTDIDNAFTEAGLDEQEAIQLDPKKVEQALSRSKEGEEERKAKRYEERRVRALEYGKRADEQRAIDQKRVSEMREKMGISFMSPEDAVKMKNRAEAKAKQNALSDMKANADLMFDRINKQTRETLNAPAEKKFIKLSGDELKKLQDQLQQAEIQRDIEATRQKEALRAKKTIRGFDIGGYDVAKAWQDAQEKIRSVLGIQNETQPPQTTSKEKNGSDQPSA
jgi:hypothetical protein